MGVDICNHIYKFFNRYFASVNWAWMEKTACNRFMANYLMMG